MDPQKPSDLDAEAIDAELKFHFSETVDALVEQGWPETVARAEAERRFGNRERYRRRLEKIGRQGRQRRSRMKDMMSPVMELFRRVAFVRDICYGLRQVRRNAAFSALAIATLALGIGGVTAMFSAIDSILIRPLPYADADRLVMVWDDMSKSEGDSTFFSTPAEWAEWRRLNSVFTDLACSQPGNAILSGDGEPEEVRARKVTWNLWSILGLQPALGRVFTEDEDDKGAKVVVISHGLWQRRFGGASDILGRKISVNDEAHEVIGVMPQSFYFMPSRDIDMWMPASFPPGLRGNFTWHSAQIVARLKPGVTLEHARQSMAALSLQVTAKDFRGPHSVTVIPLREEMAGKIRTALTVLLWASAALLLIACVNLANLLLSRSRARGREVALRAALGAGRGRLIAQFLTESLVLAGLGAVAGTLARAARHAVS